MPKRTKKGAKSPKQKKQLTLKEGYNLLREAGYSSKEAMLIRNRSDENVRKAINTKRKKEKKPIVKKKGFIETVKEVFTGDVKPKEAATSFFKNETILRKKPQPRKKGKRLFIYWTDPSGSADASTFASVLKQVENMSDADMIGTALWGLDGADGERAPSEVGEYEIRVADYEDRGDLNDFYFSNGWVKVYEGRAKYTRPLMRVITAMLLMLYDDNQKLQFIEDLAVELVDVNPDMALKIKKIFNV